MVVVGTLPAPDILITWHFRPSEIASIERNAEKKDAMVVGLELYD